MSKAISNRKLGIMSIIWGGVTALFYSLNFFVDYYSSIGTAESCSALGFSILLCIGGIFLLNDKIVGLYFVTGYVIGALMDRVIVLFLFAEYATFDIFVLPLLGGLGIGALLLPSTPKFGLNMNSILVLVVIALITLFPKIEAMGLSN